MKILHLKKYSTAVVFGGLPLLLSAQATAGPEPDNLLTWMYHNLFAVLALTIIFAACVALLYLSKMIFDLQKIRLLQELGMEAMEEVKLLAKDPWYTRLYNWAWSLRPIDEEQDIEFEHEYDGIRELDNVLPPWWVAMFYASIVFSFAYIGYQHFSDYGHSQAEEYEMEVAAAEKAVAAYLASQSDLVDETNASLLTNPNELALGQAIFENTCASCHGLAGEGNSIGPNLTDEYWLHGGGVRNVFKTIKYGVPEKGMVPWKSQLRASDIHRVASYIISLQGTAPPNAKEPQGEIWKEEAAEAATEGQELSAN